jgi:hypothetical protein
MLSAPVVLLILIIAALKFIVIHFCYFVVYGGEFITYLNKDEINTISEIYNELKK